MKKEENKESKKEWLPERLLINKNDVERICDNYIKKSKEKDAFFAFLGGFISYVITMVFTGEDLLKNLLAIILGVVFTLLIVIWGIRIIMSHKRGKSIENEIYEIVANNMDRTAIFLIGKSDRNINGNQEIAYLTQPHGIREKFFLYLSLNDKKGEVDLEELKNRLANTLGIMPSDVQLDKHSSYNYIKRTEDGGNEKLIRYEFVKAYFDSNKLNEKSFPDEFEWKTLKELRGDILSQKYNSDVIDYIQNNVMSTMENSFRELSEKKQIKIVWNITNKCAYNCQICATHSDRTELSLDQKMKALLSILTNLLQIAEIDFSGGDPLMDSDSCQIIKYAQSILGKQKVYVTTTGKGIERIVASKDGSTDMLYNCEITIDDVENRGDNIRGQKNYCNDNDFVINQNKDKIHNLIINVPILDPDMRDEKIKEIVDKIANIPILNKKIILIRLMKVGKLQREYPDQYNPQNFIERFRSYAKEKNVDVKLQCALRGRYESRSCNMLEEKIGIDCAGNVFACAWGGYIGKKIEENPFYLGNLLNCNLSDILQDSRAFHIREKLEKSPSKHCCVFSCVSSKEGNIVGEDPLFPVNESF